MFCKNCGAEFPNNTNICPGCGVPAGVGKGHCPNCGNDVHEQAVVCVKCGCGLGYTPPNASGTGEQKSRLIAGLLGILLGYLGIHNFYLGYTSKGVTQLLLSTVGGLLTCGLASMAAGIWGLVEGILILTGSNNFDANGQPLKD